MEKGASSNVTCDGVKSLCRCKKDEYFSSIFVSTSQVCVLRCQGVGLRRSPGCYWCWFLSYINIPVPVARWRSLGSRVAFQALLNRSRIRRNHQSSRAGCARPSPCRITRDACCDETCPGVGGSLGTSSCGLLSPLEPARFKTSSTLNSSSCICC